MRVKKRVLLLLICLIVFCVRNVAYFIFDELKRSQGQSKQSQSEVYPKTTQVQDDLKTLSWILVCECVDFITCKVHKLVVDPRSFKKLI